MSSGPRAPSSINQLHSLGAGSSKRSTPVAASAPPTVHARKPHAQPTTPEEVKKKLVSRSNLGRQLESNVKTLRASLFAINFWDIMCWVVELRTALCFLTIVTKWKYICLTSENQTNNHCVCDAVTIRHTVSCTKQSRQGEHGNLILRYSIPFHSTELWKHCVLSNETQCCVLPS